MPAFFTTKARRARSLISKCDRRDQQCFPYLRVLRGFVVKNWKAAANTVWSGALCPLCLKKVVQAIAPGSQSRRTITIASNITHNATRAVRTSDKARRMSAAAASRLPLPMNASSTNTPL
jgi:hypothetical protein